MDNEDGMPYFVSFGLWLTDLVHQSNSRVFLWFYQAVFGIITATSLLVENILSQLIQKEKMMVVVTTAVFCLARKHIKIKKQKTV